MKSMSNADTNSQKKVIDYYRTRESRWGYNFLLKGVKHLGYYPEGRENISMSEAQRLMTEELYATLNLESDSLVLDAGCGEGETAIILAKKYQLRVKGIDILDFNIKKANEKRKRLGLEERVKFQVMDYMKLAFSSTSFDGVYTLETLVHAPDYRRVLQEFFRILKPGGKLVLFEYSVSSPESIAPQKRKVLNIVNEGSGMYSLPHFIHGEFPNILEASGFSTVSVENITPRVMPMLKKFYQIAYLPYLLIRLLGLQRRFINATAAAEGLNAAKKDFWRYNIIIARKK